MGIWELIGIFFQIDIFFHGVLALYQVSCFYRIHIQRYKEMEIYPERYIFPLGTLRKTSKYEVEYVCYQRTSTYLNCWFLVQKITSVKFRVHVTWCEYILNLLKLSWNSSTFHCFRIWLVELQLPESRNFQH